MDNENKHILLVGKSGGGWGHYYLSENCVAGLVRDGVKFVKGKSEIILTKEELIREFQIGLEKGYFTMQDLMS